MKTNNLYAPNQRILKAIKATLNEGLSRIEISYYAKTKEVESKLLTDEMAFKMKEELNIVFNTLNQLSGICYRVPLIKFFNTFEENCKYRQLYIE